MPDLWLPGVTIDRGANAGYNSGRSQMRWVVEHYTVGSDSRNSGRDGYCHFVVHKDTSRENGCTQYAEIDAVTWHAGPWNGYGPGVEFERMTTGGINDEGLSNADPLTDNQIAWGQRIVAFCAEWGIPAQLYDGPRYQADELGWAGHINHQAIDDQRSDGLLRAEWDLIAGGAPAPAPTTEEDDMLVLLITDGQNKGSVWIVTEYSYWSTTTAKLSPGRSLAVTWNEAQPYFDDTNKKRDALGLRPMGT